MWKSGFCLRAVTTFFAQAFCGKKEVIQKACGKIFYPQLSTQKFSTIHNPLCKTYKQELMLAVMSRMWFCSVSSPDFSAASTFLME